MSELTELESLREDLIRQRTALTNASNMAAGEYSATNGDPIKLAGAMLTLTFASVDEDGHQTVVDQVSTEIPLDIAALGVSLRLRAVREELAFVDGQIRLKRES